jgi:hypothetical protein
MTVRNRLPIADELVGRLVDMARDEMGRVRGSQEPGIYRLERALGTTATPRVATLARWLVLPAALAATAGVYALQHERAITFQVVRAKVGDGGYITSGSPDGAVRFSDESNLGLEPGTRLRVSRLDVRGANVMLEGGTLHVRIHPRPRANWTLDAGPYVVYVTGTEFDLAWRVEEQTLDLRLRKGSVIVEGPLAPGGVKMDAGQHLFANANAGTLSLADELNTPPTSDETPVSSALATRPAALGEPSGAVAPALNRARTSASRGIAVPANARAEEQNWNARVARGDFEGVVEDAERRGIDKALAESSAGDLAALADAARYARRQDVARRALITSRVRFPDSVQARDAPFFLGGLAEAASPDVSIESYDVYLRESPNGAYASQALGRKMMLVHRLRGIDGSRPIATDYMARFPDGPYAPSARKLLQAQ